MPAIPSPSARQRFFRRPHQHPQRRTHRHPGPARPLRTTTPRAPSAPSPGRCQPYRAPPPGSGSFGGPTSTPRRRSHRRRGPPGRCAPPPHARPVHRHPADASPTGPLRQAAVLSAPRQAPPATLPPAPGPPAGIGHSHQSWLPDQWPAHCTRQPPTEPESPGWEDDEPLRRCAWIRWTRMPAGPRQPSSLAIHHGIDIAAGIASAPGSQEDLHVRTHRHRL